MESTGPCWSLPPPVFLHKICCTNINNLYLKYNSPLYIFVKIKTFPKTVTWYVPKPNKAWLGLGTDFLASISMPPCLSDLKEHHILWCYIHRSDDHGGDTWSPQVFYYNVICNYGDFCQVRNPFIWLYGIAFCPHQWRSSFLKEIIEESPSLYLDEMQQNLSNVLEFDIPIATILWAVTIVWLRHMSCDCFWKHFDFHKNMQRTVLLLKIKLYCIVKILNACYYTKFWGI